MVHVNRMKPYHDRAGQPMEDPPEDVDDEYLALEDLPPDSLADSDSAEGFISADENEAGTPPQTLHQNGGQPPEPKEEEQTGEHGSSFIDNETIFVLKTS